MKVKQLREALSDVSDESEVVILDTRFGTIGPSPCIGVRGISEGFDWDNGKLIIHPEKRMTSVDKETVDAMIKSSSDSGWRHKYQREISELKKQLEEKTK